MKKDKRVNFAVEAELYERLYKLAYSKNFTLSELLRTMSIAFLIREGFLKHDELERFL
mgnify:CR=1 FL=1